MGCEQLYLYKFLCHELPAFIIINYFLMATLQKSGK